MDDEKIKGQIGANIAERAPTAPLASPVRSLLHSCNCSPADNQLCKIATSSPSLARKDLST